MFCTQHGLKNGNKKMVYFYVDRVGGGAVSERVEMMDNGVIMFKQVAQEDQGAYMCTAENDMGVITATATLLVDGEL